MKKANTIKCAFIEIWQIIKPGSSTERYITLFLFLYFATIACLFCISVLPVGSSLGMLGYDTSGHLTYEPMQISLNNILNWNLRHPLYRLLFLPIILINEGLLSCGINITWQLFLATSTLLMSCSGLFIYKILRSFNLSQLDAILLLILYCSFAHIIMLCIQVDSFVMSQFFCTALLLLFVKRKHNSISDSLLFIGITGTTSTNSIKFALYQLFEEKSIKKALVRFVKSTFLFCLFIILTIPDLISRLTERPRGLLYAILGDSFNFQGSEISRWRLFFDNFLSEPILFHHTTGIIHSFETIRLPIYPSIGYYLPILIIFFLVIISTILNYRSKIIKLFCCFFGYDIFIHFGIGYGMEEGQLFCGHWLFFIPIVIGVFLSNLNKYRKCFLTILIGISGFLLVVNLYHFSLSL